MSNLYLGRQRNPCAEESNHVFCIVVMAINDSWFLPVSHREIFAQNVKKKEDKNF